MLHLHKPACLGTADSPFLVTNKALYCVHWRVRVCLLHGAGLNTSRTLLYCAQSFGTSVSSSAAQTKPH